MAQLTRKTNVKMVDFEDIKIENMSLFKKSKIEPIFFEEVYYLKSN